MRKMNYLAFFGGSDQYYKENPPAGNYKKANKEYVLRLMKNNND